MDYCADHLTDGFLDASAVPYLCATITGSALKRAINNLVAVGSWEKVDNGYLVHDYLRHNQTKEQVEKDREAARVRYNTWRNNHVQNHNPTPLATPETTGKKQRSNPSLGWSVGLSSVKGNYFEGNVSHETGSKGGPNHLGKALGDQLKAIQDKNPELQEPA